MTNIWGFLQQTLSLSLMAALLLFIKALLRDKLSPRWQYGVWSALALPLLLPQWGGDLGTFLPLWLETAKIIVESSLSSAYSSAYGTIAVFAPIPWPGSRPVSVTDWLFIVYCAGVLAALGRYLFSYIRLRRRLRRAGPAPEDIRERILALCQQYGLRPCRAVEVPGLPSPFICGAFSPLLALPAERELDDKVLLHELLHLKYFDAPQSVFWSLLRALHWCNPFLRFVFNQIGNDMEALCDQRILERLEGEERRAYGHVLLAMVNEAYPRFTGTSSLANGGKQITKRIAAIARFKKYPRGMALVSICIVLVLAGAFLFGAPPRSMAAGMKGGDGDWDFAAAMAQAGLARCSSLAGALDTYAQGIIQENGIFIATASPLSRREDLARGMREAADDGETPLFHLDNRLGEASISAYYVYNIKKLSKGHYEALLVFTGDVFDSERAVAIAYPVEIRREDAWVIQSSQKPQSYPLHAASFIASGAHTLPALAVYTATGQSGAVTIHLQSIHTVDGNPSGDAAIFPAEQSPRTTPNPHAAFVSHTLSKRVEYCFGGTDKERETLRSAGFQVIPADSTDGIPKDSEPASKQSIIGLHSDGSTGAREEIAEDWDGVLTSESSTTKGGILSVKNIALAKPTAYDAQIFWNDDIRETLILWEVKADGNAKAN